MIKLKKRKGRNMYPYFEIFGIKFATYGVCAFVGFLLQWFVFMYAVKKRGGLVMCAREVQMIGVFGCAVGMKLLYALTRADLWGKAPLDIIFGGSVFYGGLLGALACGFAVLKIKRINSGIYSDAAAVSIPLFHSFGRIGCFFAGCCYGKESSFGFVTENAVISECDGVERFPIQLLCALLLLLLSFFLFILHRKEVLKDKLMCVYLCIYSFGRFIIEFFRGDDVRGFVYTLSTSQIISIPIFSITLFILIKTMFFKKGKRYE